jgi:hypothetical protein
MHHEHDHQQSRRMETGIGNGYRFGHGQCT